MEIPKVTPFLMFNNQAEEAVNLYTSLFKNSEILTTPGPSSPYFTIVKISLFLNKLVYKLTASSA
jgi:predicted 3-demethylubiquinone-9 3-methyltransferase (glyoxalase superfamily)